MQKILYLSLLIFLFLIGKIQAQIVSIPDINFKNKLIALGVDTNNDGNIQKTEITMLTSLNVSNCNISSLVGIDSFLNLSNLNCSQNQLTSLDVDNLMNLTILNCSNNQIASLDVSSSTNLITLNCANNQIANLNVMGLSNLEILDCSGNLYTSLSLNTCTSLTNLIVASPNMLSFSCSGIPLTNNFDILGCTNLQSITFDGSLRGSLDLSFLADLQTINASNNSYLGIIQADGCPNLQTINCPNNHLSNLYIPASFSIQSMNLAENNFSSLDVTSQSQLTSLNVSGCTNLQTLACNNIQLTSLNISACTYLETLNCEYNQLTSLNASSLPALKNLYCHHNQLNNLPINGSNSLIHLNAAYNQLISLSGMTNMLQYLDVSHNNLSSLNTASANYLKNLNCNSNALTSLVMSSGTYLKRLDCGNNMLSSITVNNSTFLNTLYCYNNQLTSLAVSGLSSLDTLACHNNQLTTLLATGQPQLKYLTCYNNQLTNLTLTNNAYMYLDCHNNQLSSLDLSNNGANGLDCSDNPLTLLLPGYVHDSLICKNTLITSLEARDLVSLNKVNVSGCTNLQTLNVANSAIDTLELSACNSLQELHCDSTSISTLDLAALSNLQIVTCSYMQYLAGFDVSGLANLQTLIYNNNYNTTVTSLDLSACSNLQTLSCFNGSLTTLNLTACNSLQSIHCENNLITSLNLTPLLNLVYVNCAYNQIPNLDVSNHTNLQELYCNNNPLLTALNIQGCSSLQTLNCANNVLLASLDASNLANLQTLDCGSFSTAGQLSSLDITACNNLIHLDCSNQQLFSLNLPAATNLEYLDCSGNLLTSLDVSSFTNLQTFYCAVNQIGTLNLDSNTALQDLRCGVNQLTVLDASNCPNLYLLSCVGNPLLALFVKNGKQEQLYFNNTPSLQYICVDPNELASVKQAAIANGNINTVINSYCSFSPVNNFNTLSGSAIFDMNTNGCTTTDPKYTFLKTAITNGVDTGYFYTNNLGNYLNYVGTGSYTLIPKPQNPTYFSTSPATVNFPATFNNSQVQDFCILPNGISPDVEVVLVPLMKARPGFSTNYSILFHNKGNTVASGTIVLDFMGANMTLTQLNTPPSSQTANQLVWTYSNLQPFESRTILLTMQMAPPPINNINNVLNFHVNISLTGDLDNSDNDYLAYEVLAGAFDPNDKTCLEGKVVHPNKIGDYLHYLVRFQNTGNLPAENVKVIDLIDKSRFDISTVQILATSHSAYIKMEDNALQFYFENIMLADSFSNEPESHGYALFKVKSKAGMPPSISVSNKASIYFDYNTPIVTNNTITTFSNTVNINSAIEEAFFQLYPNPTQNILTIETPKSASFVMFDIMGKEVMEVQIENGKQNINVSNLPKGMYWLKEKKSSAGVKFVKQ